MESDVSINYKMDDRRYLFVEDCKGAHASADQVSFSCNKDVTSDHCIVSDRLLVTNNYKHGNLNNSTTEVCNPKNIVILTDNAKTADFCNYNACFKRPKHINLDENISEHQIDTVTNQGKGLCNFEKQKSCNQGVSNIEKCNKPSANTANTIYQNHLINNKDHDKVRPIQSATDAQNVPKVPGDNNCASDKFERKCDNDESLQTERKQKITSSRPKRKISEVLYTETLLSGIPSHMPKTEGKCKKNKNKKSSKEVGHCHSRKLFSTAHFSEMFTGFHKLQKMGKYCDVRLCTDEGSILVHSLVIITASPYFLKQFKSLSKIYSDMEPVKSLTCTDIPYWAMEKIVTFLYSGEAEIDEAEVEEFNKYCCTVGISGFEWKSFSKLTHNKIYDSETKCFEKKVKKVKHTGAKHEDKVVDNDKQTKKCKKRKLNDAQYSEKKAKKSKKVKTSDREMDADIVVKVETSVNEFEVLDKEEKNNNDNNDSCYSTTYDADGYESDVEAKELIETGDVTYSYCENDIIETNEGEVKTKDVSDEIPTKHFDEEAIKDGGICDKCGRSFFFQSELAGHKKRCTGKNNRQRKKCVACNGNFDCTEEYMAHRNTDKKCLALRQEKIAKRKERRLESRRKFACCVCPRRFKRIADMIEHEFTAHEIKYDKAQWPDLYCEFCNYWSMNPWKMHHHKLVSCSKGQEPICDMCGNKYKNGNTLKKHKELMHTDIQPMLTCEECGKSLKGKKGLKHHIRLKHRGENLHRLHMCHICSKTYRSENDLTFHLYKLHEQPLPEGFVVYRCKICDYIHNNKRFYEKHVFLHEDKREWHCEICSKAFKTRNSLHTHMNVHTSARIPCPFDDCTYKALKNCHLKNHIENQHTQKGEKREKCHLCDYSTFFKGNLIKHQRSVHKLEVVTRHSVEMKAKYKNLKSGHIVGIEQETEESKTSSSMHCNQREITGDCITVVPITQHNLPYPVASSSDNSVVENQGHYQEKPMSVAPQNIVDPLTYSVNNAPMFSRHGNFPTAMYGIPPLDFSTYYTGSTMHQM